jgi:nicotinamidase-related amidase
MHPEQLALILIDIQRDFWQPLSQHKKYQGFPENVKKLLSFARSKGFTVIHVQSCFKQDKSDWMLFYRPEGRGNVPCIEGTNGVKMETFSAPINEEIIITKQTFDAFINTKLKTYLKEYEVKVALIAGIETSVCVLFTATSAYLNGILPLVVSDACADEPVKHDTILRYYNDLSFKTVTTEQVQDEWPSIEALYNQFIDIKSS